MIWAFFVTTSHFVVIYVANRQINCKKCNRESQSSSRANHLITSGQALGARRMLKSGRNRGKKLR